MPHLLQSTTETVTHHGQRRYIHSLCLNKYKRKYSKSSTKILAAMTRTFSMFQSNYKYANTPVALLTAQSLVANNNTFLSQLRDTVL